MSSLPSYRNQSGKTYPYPSNLNSSQGARASIPSGFNTSHQQSASTAGTAQNVDTSSTARNILGFSNQLQVPGTSSTQNFPSSVKSESVDGPAGMSATDCKTQKSDAKDGKDQTTEYPDLFDFDFENEN